MRSARPWTAGGAAALAMLAGAPALAQQPETDAPVPTNRYERPPPPPAYRPQPPPTYAPLDVPNSPLFRRPQAVAPQAVPPPPPEPQPAEPPPRTAARPTPGRTVELQIGAFADRANAEKAARAARAAGSARIVTTTVGGKTWHRVIVGPGPEREMRAALARLGFRDARAL